MTPQLRRWIIEDYSSSDEQLFTQETVDNMLDRHGVLLGKAIIQFLKDHPMEFQRLSTDELFVIFMEEIQRKAL